MTTIISENDLREALGHRRFLLSIEWWGSRAQEHQQPRYEDPYEALRNVRPITADIWRAVLEANGQADLHEGREQALEFAIGAAYSFALQRTRPDLWTVMSSFVTVARLNI